MRSSYEAQQMPIPLGSRRLQALGFLAVVVPFGLLWRLGPLPLGPFAFKYGGSAFWAAAVYGTIALFAPRWKPLRLGLASALLASGVEGFKLIFWPPLDRFRETLAGKLLLGRYFSYGALVAYGVAIAFTTLFDHFLYRRRNTSALYPSSAREPLSPEGGVS